MTIEERAFQIYREMRDVRCTCGWPAESGSGEHAPDCDMEIAWDRALEEAEWEFDHTDHDADARAEERRQMGIY